jgi:hypothetical protein
MALKLETQVSLQATRATSVILLPNRLVKPDTDPQFVIVCTANARALGVVQNSAHALDAVDVLMAGIVPIECGAALATPGTALVSDAVGRVVAAGATGDQNIVGYSQNVTGGIGELCNVFLWPQTKYSGTASLPTQGTITVPASSHSMKVLVALLDYLGNALTQSIGVTAYLSNDAAGLVACSTTLTNEATCVTNGYINTIETTKLVWNITTSATGLFDLTFAFTGANTIYLNIILPNGTVLHSGAILFTA